MKRIVIFCGAGSGNDESIVVAAGNLGTFLATTGWGLVYGGAQIGIMGAVANAVLANGGHVTGVIPIFLKTKEVAHDGIQEMIVTETMHERKRIMHELSDAVIALPGGFGTMEELFEMLTWAQLDLHRKPIILFNINGFYDALITMIDHMVATGFLSSHYRTLLIVCNTIDDVASIITQFQHHGHEDDKSVGLL